ncbi:cytidine and deoxycytidylate deaminase [Neorickettsia helminthoeca str. Oregon]|uniref:tRNA-specific adenosine deaminase n=2 Tax=Neorickettsia helminthoeca TaxID=33994 RepID=X5HL43_9RICK|nr:cytidine and deoxycytidylate deaminase [Neorickettsia helminthoeca str. Oregon]
MKLALEIARESDKEVPVGAVLVQDGVVVASSGNRMFRDSDPTAHAEMIVIKVALKKLGSGFLDEAELYVTLEPCPMCMYAISLSRIKALYFAAYDEKRGAISNCCLGNDVYFHIPQVYDGLMQEEASSLLSDFFKKLRNKKDST